MRLSAYASDVLDALCSIGRPAAPSEVAEVVGYDPADEVAALRAAGLVSGRVLLHATDAGRAAFARAQEGP